MTFYGLKYDYNGCWNAFFVQKYILLALSILLNMLELGYAMITYGISTFLSTLGFGKFNVIPRHLLIMVDHIILVFLLAIFSFIIDMLAYMDIL